LLAICHAFKIDRNAIWTAGVIRPKKYSAVRTTATIIWKKFHLLGRQWFSIQNSKLFSLSKIRGNFSTSKNPIRFSFLWCFRFAHLSLLAHISKVLLYRCQDICHFFHFHCTNIDEQDIKIFSSIVKLFPTKTLWDSRTSKQTFCSLLFFHQAVNVTCNIEHKRSI